MRVDYSKPLGDIQLESDKRTAEAAELAARQREAVKFLAGCPPRERCTNCGTSLRGERFMHRSLPFVRCVTCGHIVSEAQPPEDYPRCVPGGTSFAEIYPEIDDAAYEGRKQRVYRPKLDWLLDCLADLPIPIGDYREMRWVELGSGAGYFLSALADAGVKHCTGVESDTRLAEVARRRAPGARIVVCGDPLDAAIERFEGDVYAAFFVLEHVAELVTVWDRIRHLPAGTVVAFSVPTYGVSCMLEEAFPECYARSLEGVVHTQLFTDQSIEHAMRSAGVEIAAKWVFGQDAQDLCRFLLARAADVQSATLLAERREQLVRIQDAIQQVIDHHMLSDQRHVLGQRV